MGIGAIGSYSSQDLYGALSSGNRINRAADDAAGSAINQKMLSEERGSSAAMNNIQDGISALNVADGSLGSVSDYLQSIKELSVKAANGLYTKADKQAIQDQIDQYKQGIVDSVNSATFNGKNLLDGSFSNVSIVSSASGDTKDLSIGEIALDQLGLSDYDVTGDFDMSKVDDALETVNSKIRSKVGADTNALYSQYANQANYNEQITASRSNIADLDMPAAISEMKKQRLLEDVKLQMQKSKMDQEAQNNIVTRMLG